jgi:hypothetical protein
VLRRVISKTDRRQPRILAMIRPVLLLGRKAARELPHVAVEGTSVVQLHNYRQGYGCGRNSLSVAGRRQPRERNEDDGDTAGAAGRLSHVHRNRSERAHYLRTHRSNKRQHR